MSQTISVPDRKPEELEKVIKTCRSALKAVIVFSLFINLMMLAAPLYMLQVFDRVITSGSSDTLLYLTMITIAAIAALATTGWAAGVTEDLDADWHAVCDAEIRECVRRAEEKPAPDLRSLFVDVYAEQPWHLREQEAECLAGPRARVEEDDS